MKLTVNQLRRIIREETTRVLGEAAVNPTELEAMDEHEVLGVVAEIGKRVMGAGNQSAGLVYAHRGAGNPALADKLAEAVAKIDEECQALQVCVAALKRKLADVRARQNMSGAG